VLSGRKRLLILGGQRSGKSRHAETLVKNSRLVPVLIATATAGDDEMAARIESHQQGRGEGWTTIEEPLDLADAIGAASRADRAVLVDCLTLWLSNLMMAERPTEVATAELVAALRQAPGPVVLVSNEVGAGIMPDNPLARRFADAQGRLNQAVAAEADEVVLMVAGIPLAIKGPA
jgi:adenosylcobinamide kinase/adenosylcobinamide-phosphate guanylyltransferase